MSSPFVNLVVDLQIVLLEDSKSVSTFTRTLIFHYYSHRDNISSLIQVIKPAVSDWIFSKTGLFFSIFSSIL